MDEQPTILIEVPKDAHKATRELLSELVMILPNATERTDATEPKDTDVVVKIQEDIGPQFLVFSSSTSNTVFKIIEYRSRSSLGLSNEIRPGSQLVLSHFKTELGMRVASLFMSLFPIDLESNQVVNFTVHKDFLYFRMYRFCIKEKGPVFEKLGPHLTLRLWRITDIEGTEKKVQNYQKYIKNANLL